MKAQWDRPVQVDKFPRPIGDEELAFLQRVRPDDSLAALRELLLKWWTKVMLLDTQKYACVRELYFLKTSVDTHPKYQEALARKIASCWWIDIGSAFGQDVRLPVMDGWPANRMLASDLIPDLWEEGLSLYPNPDNIKFMTANVVDPSPTAEHLQAYDGSAEVVSSNLVFHTLSKELVDGMLSAIMRLLMPESLREAMAAAGFQDIDIQVSNLSEGHRDHEKIYLKFSGLKQK